MAKHFVGAGTLLNSASVLAGGAIGLLAGHGIPPDYKPVVIAGIGLVTLGLGAKMFLESRNVLVVVVAIVTGGILGLLLGIEPGLQALADWARSAFGAEDSGNFQRGFVTTSLLFCVGPMTLLGCFQDALEDKIELLAIKSALDGVSALFFAAALGPGVLLSAGVVLVVQGSLTLLARPLRRTIANPALLAEASAVGGLMLIGIGIGLLDLAPVRVATYLPALLLAPALAMVAQRFPRFRSNLEGSGAASTRDAGKQSEPDSA